MDHGRIATEPGHPVRTVAAHLWNRCAGDLLYEAAQETPCFAFFLCAVVTGVVEYIIGVVGIHLFGMRLWDYRGLLLNLDGIICLRSVMSFALMGLVFHYLLEPEAERMVSKMHPKTVHVVCLVLPLLFLVDCFFSALFRTPITY